MQPRKNDKEPLLPERHTTLDLFICDVANAVLKDVMPQMEHPFYSLSKKPETKVRKYEHNGNWLKVSPGSEGLATIYDKDILIYCISQIMAKLRNGQKVSRKVRLNCRDLLMFTNRGTAGKDYEALSKAIDRLAGTRISTNIKTGDEEQIDNFGLVNAASIRRKNGLDGRLLWCDIELSEWVFNAIRHKEVLTLHPDYFRLRKPLERRVYELARKHCGQQRKWAISLATLLKKTGSRTNIREFKRMLNGLVANNHLPDYEVFLEQECVVFLNRTSQPERHSTLQNGALHLKEATFDKARQAAPGYDIYALHQDWIQHWTDSGHPELISPDAAFIGFCRQRAVQARLH